jgi:hypothetical protein
MMSSIQVDWKAATWSGIIAGFVFLVLEMVMVPLFGGGSLWGPPRMMAAIVLGKGVLPPPATFDLGIVMVAMGLHFVLSIVYAVIFALMITRMSLGPAMALGGVGGLILYLVNFYGFTALFPWFAMARNWISIFAHIVFGLTVAGVYVPIRKHHLQEEAHGGASFRERKV